MPEDDFSPPYSADRWDVSEGILRYLRALVVTNKLLLGVDDLPDLLSIPDTTLAAMFARYGQPPSILAGRRRVYRRADLEAWVASLPAEAPTRAKAAAG